MLIISSILLLTSNAVSFRRDKTSLCARSIIAALIICLLLTINSLSFNFLDKGIGLYHGLFQANDITHIFHIFIFLISGLILQLNSFYPRKLWNDKLSNIRNFFIYKLIYFNNFIINKMSEQFRILEYPLVILFVIIGGTFLISSSDLMSIFLAIELQSYGLYLLCSVYRDSEKATSAGLMYFLLGGLSSCFILLASSLLYSNSGNTNFDGLYIINNISNISDNSLQIIENKSIYEYKSYYINSSLTIMSIGFLFKVTAAPFHFWSPDVYDAIPTIVTTFVAIFAKISIFILLLELVYFTNSSFLSENNNYSWTFTLLVSSLFSLIVGSILGLTQFRIKKLYAYSTISHVGFILLALSINTIESIQSFMFYLLQYSISNLNAFIILITMGYSLYLYVEKNDYKYFYNLDKYKLDTRSYTENYSKQNQIDEWNEIKKDEISIDNLEHNISISPINDEKDKYVEIKNSPLQLISQMKGYFYINPVLAISLSLTIFSFVGIPPLIGFFAKQMILSSALINGYVFMAFIAILTSVISACYYLALMKQVFFEKSDYISNPQLMGRIIKCNLINKINNFYKETILMNDKNIKLSSSLSITISILTLVVLLFILNPQIFFNMTNIMSLILFNT